jgi:hypothetical protein
MMGPLWILPAGLGLLGLCLPYALARHCRRARDRDPPKSFEAFVALDFDGVLHPGQSETLELLPLFCDWARRHPQVGFVIASSWREHLTLDELRALFPEDLRARIVGATPTLTGVAREVEIDRFFASLGLTQTRWVALDDDLRGYPTLGLRVVAPDYLQGITPEVLQRLSALV